MTFLCHSFEAIVMCVWICFRAAWLSSYPGAIKERNCSPQLIGRAWLQLPSQQQRNVCAASESPKNAKQQQSACENRYSYGYMHQHWIKDCVIPHFIFRSINDFLKWTFGVLTSFLRHSEFLRTFFGWETFYYFISLMGWIANYLWWVAVGYWLGQMRWQFEVRW